VYEPAGRYGAVMSVEGRLGTTVMPGVFAQAGMEYAGTHDGVSFEQFAKVAEKNHAHSTLNPLASYQKLLDPQNSVGQDFLHFFWNSLFVSTITTILSVIVAVPAAYAFSRFSFPGRNFLFFSVLLRNMFPAVIFLVPLFILMRLLGLVNTPGSLILTYMTFGLPLAIWLLKGFYDNIPIQLEQAARIDGATRLRAFLTIVMPLSVPGIIATAIYSFIGAWNEYIYAYTFLNKNDQLTLPIGIQRFFSENTTDFPGLMAASFLMSVPVVVLFLVLQRYFVRALTEGAVKH
jgi:multiple sugar transport system permease protein